MNEDGQTDSLTEAPIKQSRWVAKSAVPRYDKKTEDALIDQFGEEAGWHHGARVGTC